ncbi:class II aldolase/adducin family protein [Pandoraea soli]
MILRNHGLLVAGRSVAEAFDHIFFLERACQIQIKALSAGANGVGVPSPQVCEHTASQYLMDAPEIPPFVNLAWRAALREAGLSDSDVYS